MTEQGHCDHSSAAHNQWNLAWFKTEEKTGSWSMTIKSLITCLITLLWIAKKTWQMCSPRISRSSLVVKVVLPGCYSQAGCLLARWRWCRVSRWWRRHRYNLQQYFSSRALNSTHDHQINRLVHLGRQHRSRSITSAPSLYFSRAKRAEGINWQTR